MDNRDARWNSTAEVKWELECLIEKIRSNSGRFVFSENAVDTDLMVRMIQYVIDNIDECTIP